jgi:hypothetical protein
VSEVSEVRRLKASIPVLNRKVEVKVKEKRSSLRWESFFSCFLLLNLNLSLNLVLQKFD